MVTRRINALVFVKYSWGNDERCVFRICIVTKLGSCVLRFFQCLGFSCSLSTVQFM